MIWFKHDTHASIDSKLQELMLDYGAAGYGLYWYCVELIAQRVDKDNVTFELEHDARIIARNLNLTVAETTNMMKKMVELNLFSFSENNKLACYALAKRLDQSMTSNQEMRKIIANIKSSHDVVMIESCRSHDGVSSEEKRREENNNAPQIENLDDVNIKYFEQIWKEYTLKHLKSMNRRGGKKHIARERFLKLMKKYSISDVKDLVVNEYRLKLGSRDLERVFTIESMKQFMEDRA